VEPGSDQPRLALPRQVLAEVTDCTRGTPGVETGGILIGHLRWDPEARDLFVEVTAQIHARWAVGTETRLHFSAANWTEVRSIVALRKQGESVLGWWHSHPVASWCRQCPEERQRVCPLQAGFLSEEDSTLHRACFPRAYTAALVCSDVADGEVRFAMFGWHGGQLGRRGYHIHGGELPPAWIGPVVDDGRKASEKRGEACVPK
jgi:proteasome lid subunit RPN8/RPN11